MANSADSSTPLFGDHTMDRESLIQRFDDAWRAGRQPNVREYVQQANGDAEHVLVELLLIEIEYRYKAGQSPNVQEYLGSFAELERLPEAVSRLKEWCARWRDQRPPAGDQGTEDGASTLAFDASIQHDATFVEITCRYCGRGNYLPPHDTASEITCVACSRTFRHTPLATPQADEGDRRGKYELLEKVGEGAFGIVYRARDVELERTVAVKIARRGVRSDRFLSEARKAAQLNHPLIVMVHESGHFGDTPYIASEFVEGATLEQAIQTQAFDGETAAELMTLVAHAIGYAHSRGIIHRDLKPSNIMLQNVPLATESIDWQSSMTGSVRLQRLGEHGFQPRVMDFGLALRTDSESMSVRSSGRVLGTAAYMSPEQARGDSDSADQRSDIFSLGVILYRLLTRELPFRGSLERVIHAVLNEEPVPLRRLNERIPRDLETITLKCLAKEPARRYQKAEELGRDLQRWLRGAPIHARPVTPLERTWRWCLRNKAVAALAAATAVMVVAIVAISSGFAVYQKHIAQKLLSEQRRSNRLLVEQLVDRSTELFRHDEHAKALLYLTRAVRLADDDAHDLIDFARLQLTARLPEIHRLEQVRQAAGSITAVAVSLDGQTVATGQRDGQVQVWSSSADAGPRTRLKHPGAVRAVALSSDGRRLITAGDDVIVVQDLAAGAKPLEIAHQGVSAVAFEDKRGLILAAGNSVLLLRAQDGFTLARLPEAEGATSLIFAETAEEAWIGTEEGVVQRWRFDPSDGDWKASLQQTSSVSTEFQPRIDAISCLQLDSQGKLHVGTIDGAAYVLQPGTDQLGERFATKHGPIRAFSRSGHLAITEGVDASSRIWDLGQRTPIGPPLRHPGAINASVIENDGRLIYTGGSDGSLRRWRIAQGPSGTQLVHDRPVMTAAFAGDDVVLSASADGTIRRWQASTGESLGEPMHLKSPVVDLKISPSGRQFLALDSQNHIQAYRVHDGSPRGPRISSPTVVLDAQFADENHIVALVSPHQLQVWDLAGEGSPRVWNHHTPLMTMTWDLRRKSMLVADEAGGLHLLDLQAKSTPLRAASQVTPRLVKVSPLRQRLLVSDRDRCFQLVDAQEMKPVGAIVQDASQLRVFEFSPQGSVLAVAGDSKLVQLWNADAGTREGMPFEHEAPINSLDFDSSGRLMATASGNLVRYWDVTVRRPLGFDMRHDSPVDLVKFSPDRRLVLSVSGDRVTLWPVPVPFEPLDRDLEGSIEQFTGLQMDENGGVVPIESAQWPRVLRSDSGQN